jgi:uncharacterized membrane protein
MVRIQNSIVIKRSARDIFEFLSNPDSDPLWQTHVVWSKKTSEGPMGVGTLVSQESHFLGKHVSYGTEITLYEPYKNFAWNITSGPLPGGGGWSLEALGEEETRVTVHAELEVGSFFRMAEPLVARAGKRQNEANFATLKEMLEAE